MADVLQPTSMVPLPFMTLLHRALAYRGWLVACVLGAMGVAVAGHLLSHDRYQATAVLLPETESGSSIPRGLTALQGLGLDVGALMNQEGLSPETYLALLETPEIRLALLRSTALGTPDGQALGDYLIAHRPLGFLRKGPPAEPELPLSRRDMLGLALLQKRVQTSLDPRSGLMTLKVDMPDAAVAVAVAEVLVSELELRAETLRTEKARRHLAFITTLHAEAEERLRTAERALFGFLERNREMLTAGLMSERQRLERRVLFETQVYTELQSQKTQSEIDVQRSSPVVTVLAAPLPPARPLGSWPVWYLLWLGVGVGVALGTAILRVLWEHSRTPATV